jgi:hypothetical protein
MNEFLYETGRQIMREHLPIIQEKLEREKFAEIKRSNLRKLCGE